MKISMLMENWEFNDKNPNAEPLFVSHDSRILRFALRPGQAVREHQSPHSPVYIVVLEGQGMFSSEDGVEKLIGPDTLVVFEAGEVHALRALDEDLVFVTFLHGSPAAQ